MREVHLIPYKDAEGHCPNSNCPCKPAVLTEEGGDDMVVHCSSDSSEVLGESDYFVFFNPHDGRFAEFDKVKLIFSALRKGH